MSICPNDGWNESNFGWFEHYVNEEIHREDGYAAYCKKNGVTYYEWWYRGEYLGRSTDGYTQEKFETWKRLKVFL